ncbi:MAG: hypothetical protein IJC68_02620, partial [Firmicutes bacterium]|nr:hypothetical protein [Bacillota bacterium]
LFPQTLSAPCASTAQRILYPSFNTNVIEIPKGYSTGAHPNAEGNKKTRSSERVFLHCLITM